MKMHNALISISAFGLGLCVVACDADVPTDAPTNSGGGTGVGAAPGGTGSTPGAGGIAGTGSAPGAPGAGGGVGTGSAPGTPGAGGGVGTGSAPGTPGAGGIAGTGSAPGAGGVVGTGSAPGAGGVVGTGSAPGAGGTGTGGDINLPEPSLTTSSQAAGWQASEVTDSTGAATVTVDTGTKHQRWDGFGGTFNEMGWNALLDLPEAERLRAVALLFDPVNGAGFTYGRIPIGSSDYGNDRYSLAETADDFAMADFSIARDQQELIPYIKAALAVKPNIRFWGSPWSPPPWMKTNNAFDKGDMKTDAQTLGAHALYLLKFVQAYAAEGIVVEAVHPQNEPGWAQEYPSCGWPGNLMADYIADHLGPLLAAESPSTEIWLGTMSNTESSTIVSSVMGNGTAAGYVKGIGLQWGMVDNASQYVGSYGGSIPIMQTEHQCGNNPWETGDQPPNASAPNDYAYGEESWDRIKSWLDKGVNSYLAWNMVLDTLGKSLDDVRVWHQNALLVVDRGSKKLILTPTYYVFRHLAQYVEPGATRVGTSGGDAIAFENPDGSIVTILHNSGGSPSQEVLSAGGRTVEFEVPGQGWATVNLQAN